MTTIQYIYVVAGCDINQGLVYCHIVTSGVMMASCARVADIGLLGQTEGKQEQASATTQQPHFIVLRKMLVINDYQQVVIGYAWVIFKLFR